MSRKRLRRLRRSLKTEREVAKAEVPPALNDVEGVGKTLDEAPRARLCNTLKVHAVDKHLHRPQQSSSQVDGLGHIYVRAVFYNAVDYIQYLEGRLRLDDVRMAEVEALIDTGAAFPALPEDVVAKLALPTLGEHPAETAEGTGRVRLAANVIIRIEDRIAQSPIIIRPRGTTPLIGVVVLEQMGYKVDPTTGKLIKGLPLML
jgi:clan AA aspartic protease